MTSDIHNLKDMMLQQIRSLYDADHVILESLPHLKDKAQSKELKEFLELEIEEKVRQQHRMEMIFSILKENLRGESDEVMRCMTLVQRNLIERCLINGISDTMIIILARSNVAHQVNGYQTAVSCAVALGYSEIARLLRRGLREEKGIEKHLGLLEEVHVKHNSDIPH